MALVSVILLIVLMAALIAAYFGVAAFESAATRSSLNASRGFYAAEAGANIRADDLRRIFVGYNRPMGASPTIGGGTPPCEGSNLGSGDFDCRAYEFAGRTVQTYEVESPGNPTSIVIPRGELYQNLNAQEYRYVGHSIAEGRSGRPEALLEVHLNSRLVPMFQFAAFYNKDLEILPGPDMTLAGPVHTNGNLYLGAASTLSILGQVTAAGDIYRGRKDDNTCQTGPVSVIDPSALRNTPACTNPRHRVTDPEMAPFNGMLDSGVDVITVPPPEILDPTPGQIYFDKADLRLMLDLTQVPPVVQVRDPNGAVNAARTAALQGCGSASYSNSLFNNREGVWIQMLDVDARDLLDCIHQQAILGPGKDVDDSSEGGLVLYLGVDGPNAAGQNNYGVRVRNAAELDAPDATAPNVKGLTVVTSQAVYVQGSFNSVNKKPAAFLADSLNILSNNWNDANSNQNLDNRIPTATTVNAAFLAGTDTTGNIEGSGGEGIGQYNGGLENYPRFHEKWTGVTFTYRGSFISLGVPRHVDGAWVGTAPQYVPPNRDWGFDTDFNQADKLPPLSPRFVYLRQELFTRQFDR